MNPTVDNDLQKAIDDITKNTNVDPVFSDPVAAPSSVPEGDSGVLGEPVGPISDIRPATAPAPRPMPRPVAPAPRPVMPAPAPTPVAMPMPPAPTPMPTPATIPAPIPAPTPVEASLPPAPEPVMSSVVSDVISESVMTTTPTSEIPTDMRSVKEAALRDLAPLLGKIPMDSSKKFNLYKNIHEELHDDSVIGDAYATAKDIADDTERGEALLYLVESIDNM